MRHLLPIIALVLLLPANAGAEVVYKNKEECLESLLSTKYCPEGASKSSEIIAKARADAGLPGGDFSDRIWLSKEVRGVSSGDIDTSPHLLALGLFLILLVTASLVDWHNIKRRGHLLLFFLTITPAISFVVYYFLGLRPSVFINAAFLFILMLAMIFLSRENKTPLCPSLPTKFFFIASLPLLLIRPLLAFSSQAYDIGQAGAVGARLLLQGERIYGNFSGTVPGGDTYGPLNYISYIPFEILFPLGDIFSSSETAGIRLHTIAFDLLVVLILFLIGGVLGNQKGLQNRLGAILVFAYLAFPLNAFHLLGVTNDALPTFFILLAFFFFIKKRESLSGTSLAAGALSKFTPGLLLPVFARRDDSLVPSPMFIVSFIITSVVLLFEAIMSPGLFWEATFATQISQLSPNSTWGQLEISSAPYMIIVIGVSLLGFFWPKVRFAGPTAAIAAAALLAFQGGQIHWFYTYFVWVSPLVFLALLGPYNEKNS